MNTIEKETEEISEDIENVGLRNWGILMMAVFCVGVLGPAFFYSAEISHKFELLVAWIGVFIILAYIINRARKKRS